MDAALAALENALLARGVEQAALVGHSGGAYRALGLAVSKRVQVTRLVLLGATPGPLENERAGWHGFAAALRDGADLSEMFAARMLPAPARAAHPEWVEKVKGWLRAVPPQTLADELAAFGDAADLRPRLSALRVPVVARVGALDEATPPELSAQIVDRIEGARLQVVPDRGHALLIDDEEATIAAVCAALG